MWRKVQCLQNVKSCQISIGRSVLINTVFVGKEEEVPSVESISKVWFPGKKPQSILLLLEDSSKVSDPGRWRWSSPSTQADAASSCASDHSDTPLTLVTLYSLLSTFISVTLFISGINPM